MSGKHFRWNELYTCIKISQNESIPVSRTILFTNSTNYSSWGGGVNISICATPMRDSSGYTRDYILLANFLVMAFIPFLILTAINSMLYRTITKSTTANMRSSNRQKRDLSIAMILVGIVVVFVICNIFRIIINLYEVKILNIL